MNYFYSKKEATHILIEMMINAGYRGTKKELLEMSAYEVVKIEDEYSIKRRQ